MVFDGHAGGWGDFVRNSVTWISHRPSTSSLRTPSDINLELAQRISSSLRACHSSTCSTGCLKRRPTLWWPASNEVRREDQSPNAKGTLEPLFLSFLSHFLGQVLFVSRVAPRDALDLSWVGAQPGPPLFFGMGAQASAASSSTQSSWSSGSDLPGIVNTWNDALLASYHYETGRLSRSSGVEMGRQRYRVLSSLQCCSALLAARWYGLSTCVQRDCDRGLR